MPDKMFVLPTKDVCIDGIKHWWLSLPWPNIFRWCRECGTYVTDNRAEIPAIRPNMYDRLAEVLKKRPADYVSRNIRNLKGRFLIPDENFCIVGAEKHRFKKVFEYSIDKNKKEFRVIEVCEICGTLTVAKYKYAGIIGLGTINKDKIIRSRRRMLAGSQRMNYGLVPDIFMKLEKAVPSCKVDINKNLFWWHASIYESCGWHEDMAQSPLGVSIAKPCDPSGGWTSAPSAGEHWTTADEPKKVVSAATTTSVIKRSCTYCGRESVVTDGIMESHSPGGNDRSDGTLICRGSGSYWFPGLLPENVLP